MKWLTDLIAIVAGFQPEDRKQIGDIVSIISYLDESLYLTETSREQFMQRIVKGYVSKEEREFIEKHPKFTMLVCGINNLLENHIFERFKSCYYGIRYEVQKFRRPRQYTLKMPDLNGKEYQEFDTILFYSVFSTLVQFVETECRREAKYRNLEIPPFEEPGYIALRSNNDADRKAMAAIYWWYKNVYIPRRYAGEAFISDELCKAIKTTSYDFKSKYDMVAETDALFYKAEEQEMLLKLCSIRDVMWT